MGAKRILVIGSLNVDMVVNVDHTPVVGETILSGEMDLIPGGKGANQACACGRLGADVTMLGAIGDDGNGDLQIRSLKNSGVDVSRLIRKEEASTGVAMITVNQDGDNCIVVVSGANAKLSPEDIDQNEDLIRACDIVIMQLEIPLDTVCHAAKLAKSLGKLVILDPAPVPKEFPEELYQYLDVIKPNETEIAMLTGITCENGNYEKAAEFLKKKGVRDVLVTLGGEGVYLDSEDCGTCRIPAHEVQVVDTTAAGDTFTAALALRMAQGDNLKQAAEFANYASAIVVTRKGAQSSIPSLQEVEEYIQQ